MATKEKAIMEIRPLDIKEVPVRIVGDTPLIVHAWSEKAKRQMLEKQTKATKTKAREIRRPFEEFVNSMYWLTDKPVSESDEELEELYVKALEDGAKFGFPTNSIKQAGNSAAYRMGIVSNQMALRGSYFIKSEFGDFAEIKGCIPEIREDCVKIQTTTDLRYRGQFNEWYMDLILEYNANGTLTLEQILNCINLGGYAVGIGEWRPERDGRFGTYHIATK